MSTIVEIKIAELYAGNAETTIVTKGVGSCIVIVLYDRLSRKGGMAHAILPKNKEPGAPPIPRDENGKRFVKYADQAVDMLVEEIEALGGAREHVVAKLVGGARMFSLLEGDKYGIGWENSESARARLKELNIPVETEVVGGTVGRNVKFDCGSGIVEITTKV